MEKHVIGLSLLAMLSLGVAVNAESGVPDPRTKELTRDEVMALPKEQRREYMQKLIAIKSGGPVKKPGTGKGSLKIISSVAGVDSAFMDKALKTAWKILKIDMSVVPGKAVTIATAKESLKAYGAQAGVFVVEDDVLPRLLTAPEEGWGIVNVKKCAASPNESRDKVMQRVRKEIIRAMVLASGAGNSGNVMQSVTNLESLDGILVEAVPLQARAAMLSHLANLGIEPVHIASYLKACQEGWAPAPTNDVQKAIWDKVHALPTEPMKILPETKKVSD